MKRLLYCIIILAITSGIACGRSMDSFINYCSKINETKVLKANRFDFDSITGMDIETGYMLMLPDAPKNVIQNIVKKMGEINDSQFIPVIQKTDSDNIVNIYLEQNGSKALKRLVVVTITDHKVNILNVKGRINQKYRH